jgi:hypothetical protein
MFFAEWPTSAAIITVVRGKKQKEVEIFVIFLHFSFVFTKKALPL